MLRIVQARRAVAVTTLYHGMCRSTGWKQLQLQPERIQGANPISTAMLPQALHICGLHLSSPLQMLLLKMWMHLVAHTGLSR